VQNTSMSVPASVSHHGQPLHQIVWALPLREDGKIWSGSLSFTASKPIEIEIIHDYKPQQPIDEKMENHIISLPQATEVLLLLH